ncbi:neurogenic locus notch homolog protein 1-like [Haliotis rufescens]|uniref:neurogenic locus notch homolog protein 1-like n=1 Tax=Haliotis rufescens TaxID=6454 RepID=UPI00201FA72B|nr:neurogenic locus notch homolog protein 1-like [Haliotis rufescens]XP_048242670.1 neurogenic locus notch homolog protein 1-like [Haliotis rufescens]XP_048242671.1 neurogenic locus notch homolog protein 1-like [Haliotis rufescens]XP_048242672.1 neurogenic locus notch homolog protein 1-like [Haliotis rufescens]
MDKGAVDITERSEKGNNMQLFRVPPYLPLLVLTCWAVLQGVSGSCSTDGECHSGSCDAGTSKCDCTDTGFNGDNCETDINECTATDAPKHDCHKDADCTNTPGSFTCKCKSGYVGDGKTCTLGVCSSNGNECLNGGTCDIPSDGTASTCSCAAGYTGTLCESDIDECSTSADACDTNADCTNTEGSFTCRCKSGYVGDGKSCTEGVCSEGGTECVNGGACDTSSTPTKCQCADGYTGDTCQNAGGTVKISAYLMALTVLTFFVIL